jgi:hypothetical protein
VPTEPIWRMLVRSSSEGSETVKEVTMWPVPVNVRLNPFLTNQLLDITAQCANEQIELDDYPEPGFPGWIGVRPASCASFRWWAKTLRQIRWPRPNGRDG